MNNESINQRVVKAINYLLEQGFVQKKGDIAEKLQCSPQTITEILGGRQGMKVEVLQKFFDGFNISYEYIFEGKGEILKGGISNAQENAQKYAQESINSAPNSGKTNGIESENLNGSPSPVFLPDGGKTNSTKTASKRPEIQILHHPKVADKIITQQTIPVYNVEAAANLKTVFSNKDQNILGEISMPDIPRCDGAIYVRGDSMYPLLKSGDIVGYKEIMDFQNVIFGEMYIVAYDIEGDEYVCVKYVNHSDQNGYIKLVSYNPHHDPKDIPVSRISAMALVKFSIRMNTII